MPPTTTSPLRLPSRVEGHWQRDWRLGTELAGEGELGLTQVGLEIVGRRTNPLRSLLWGLYRLALWSGLCGGIVAVVLTGEGLANRYREAAWLLKTPLYGIPALLLLSWVIHLIGRRLLQPHVEETIPWAAVEIIATDGRFIEISALRSGGRIMGRLAPPSGDATAAQVMAAIGPGGLPGGAGSVSTRRLRPVWVDWGVLALGAGLAAVGAWKGHPIAREMLSRLREPTEGPRAGIPDRLPLTQREGWVSAACERGTAAGVPRVQNRREGSTLRWEVRGARPGYEVGQVRMRAGTDQLELRDAFTQAAAGQELGFFDGQGQVGLSVVVPSGQAPHVRKFLGQGVEGLRAATCAGMVGALDHTLTPPAGTPPTLVAERDGDDLVVRVDPEGGPFHLLTARWVPGVPSSPFDLCELPVVGAELVLLPSRPERRLARFFSGEGEGARVYLFDGPAAARAQVLAREGPAQPCIQVDSLYWSGEVVARSLVRAGGTTDLAAEAAAWTREEPFPASTDPDVVSQAVVDRWRGLQRVMGGKVSDEVHHDALGLGFLQALPWTDLLDALSMADHKRLEWLRSSLTNLDPAHTLGESFLMGLADGFLERLPPGADAFEKRLSLGERWLSLSAGPLGEVQGAPVVLEEAHLPYYHVIGRFILMDVAGRLDAARRADRLDPSRAAALKLRLKGHHIEVDYTRSSADKALEAWSRGNFEYVGDRALAAVAAQFGDERAAAKEMMSARFSLTTRWSGAGGAVRYADVQMDGRPAGWVALMDGARARLSYAPVRELRLSPEEYTRERGALVACAASYVTAEGRTSGLSVYRGRVRNFGLHPSMDGLVVLRGDGSLLTLNLKEGTLPGSDQPLSPLRRVGDFNTLLRFLAAEGASAFQTHLLAFGGALTIDEGKAKPELRERRLLIQASYRGNPIVGVLDIPGSHRQSLFRAALLAHQALSTPEAQGGPGLTVQAIANLDVGAFDILEVLDGGGGLHRRGPIPLSQAHNVLTFGLK